MRCEHCGAPLPKGATECTACGGEVSVTTAERQAFPLRSLPDLVERLKRGTVYVMTLGHDGGRVVGTAFFVTYRGQRYLITNHHVVEKAADGEGVVTVMYPEELNPRRDRYRAEVVTTDAENDVTVLKTEAPLPQGATALELADLSSLRQGQRVVSVGHAQGMEFNCVEGIVSNTTYRAPTPMSMILCSLNAVSGFSGGGVVRVEDGKVIGIATAVLPQDYLPSHTVCVTADAIRQLIHIHEGKRG